ncbi:peptidylprolyl isomerase [Flavobacterium sp. J49]|uniref:peptidylprolyl isomerase n=1 Tax=Flavobacterium sp. J49 TaxID=2718534 RepID=UPI001594779A|nr:peptidylprolyl isomerase [Flavobacterium sp. J49]MBF6641971.1 peptidylprolyl isomerase [Flavobacterium sp. J49]NIC03218.1 peptidylprolyl isomerase [Flavobacterium sp. J49]
MRIALFIFVSLLLTGCKKEPFNTAWTQEQAPEIFKAKFETTKGDFEMQINRNWSPKAADRLYQLLKHGYYDNAIFYRVVPNFVAQFGNTDTAQMKLWKSVTIPDEPAQHSNTRGTVSFARSGKDSRDLEIFINLVDNTVLDTLTFDGVKGFTPLGKVSKGMEVVDGLYSGYGEEPMNNSNLYLNRDLFYQMYPKLDLIRKAYLID